MRDAHAQAEQLVSPQPKRIRLEIAAGYQRRAHSTQERKAKVKLKRSLRRPNSLRHNNLSTALVLCQLPTKCVVLVPVGTALPTNLTDPQSVRIAHPPLRPSLPAPAEPLLLTSDRGRTTWPSSAEMSKRILFPPHLLDLAFDVREAVHGRCGQFVFEA